MTRNFKACCSIQQRYKLAITCMRKRKKTTVFACWKQTALQNKTSWAVPQSDLSISNKNPKKSTEHSTTQLPRFQQQGCTAPHRRDWTCLPRKNMATGFCPMQPTHSTVPQSHPRCYTPLCQCSSQNVAPHLSLSMPERDRTNSHVHSSPVNMTT